MAMVLFYNRINWENYPSVVTPINETNLNKIDYAAKTLDERTVELYNTKADKTVLFNMIADWTLDENTGIITITKCNGNVIKFDLNIEKIPVNFEMSEDGVLKMTTEDGSIFTADIGSMIPIIKFKDSDTISVVPEIDGNEKTYSISVKEGSIEDKYLEPNYLANIKIHSQSAELASTQATESAKNAKSYSVGGTGTREDEDIDNAKYYAEKAKEAAENASAIASVEIMTTEKAGIGKPDGETITADEDGTMRVPSHSDVALNRQTLGYTKKNIMLPKFVSLNKTVSGVTFTDNGDGSIHVKGTSTALINFAFVGYSAKKIDFVSAGTKLTFSNTSDKCGVMFSSVASGTTLSTGFTVFNGEKTMTLNNDSDTTDWYIAIFMYSGVTIDETIYPMIRSADITDDTFEPYVDNVDTRLNTAKSEDALNKQTLGYTKKNLLKLKYVNHSDSEISITSNATEGTATMNSVVAATSMKWKTVSDTCYLKTGAYIFTGCPAGGRDNGYRQTLGVTYADDGTYYGDINDYGEGATFTVTQEMADRGIIVGCTIFAFEGCYVENLTFYPMLRSAEIEDGTFEPYVDDVDTRLKALTPVNNLLATLPGSPLDAVMGKTLNDKVTAVETKQGGCYLKYENGKFYIGYDDTEMGV